jgi:hypothetical protein
MQIALLVVVVLAVIVGVPVVRHAVLKTAGWALVVDEPVGPADAIVLPEWAGSAGALDAADLVHAGIARRVAVLPEPQRASEAELIRRGIHFQDETAALLELLRSLGVVEIERISTPAAGTGDEAQVISSWSEQRHLGSIILVSSPDHSRRAARVLRRVLSGRPTKVVIRSARYSSYDPDHWWETRENVRTAIVESQKLLLDVLRHPVG